MTEETEVFTASNGIQVRVSQDVARRVQYMGAHSSEWSNVGRFSGGYSVGSPLGLAVDEFYRHRNDVRLGRVRSDVDPDYVLYVSEDGKWVRVVDEKTGWMSGYYRMDAPFLFETDENYAGHRAAAKAYFEANPPKPVLPTEPGLYVNSKAFQGTPSAVILLALSAGGEWFRKDNGWDGGDAKDLATLWVERNELVRLDVADGNPGL